MSNAVPWHSQSAEETLRALEAGAEGLSDAQAAERLARHGPNRLPDPPRRSPLARLLAQFNNLLILVLIGAAAVTALMGHWIDTAVILAVVVVNSAIGYIQEGRAERALEAVKEMLAPRATVLRAGKRRTVDAAEVVPGDIVLLESGDRVPADLRLIRARSLQVQEAALTGESVPVEKTVEGVEPDAPLGDRTCLAFSGTLVTMGHASGVAVETGPRTEIGRIGGMLATVETTRTPLLKAMDRFARWLTGAVLAIAAAIFAFGILVRGYEPAEMFIAVVGLAVAAIPEGLPTILTVTLALGVQRMARRSAIVRRLPIVEALGSVNVICSDKTGTLTRNEMTVRTLLLADGTVEVEGVGYDPHGGIGPGEGSDGAAAARPTLREIALAGVLCNDAALRREGDAWKVEGDPMEGALLTLGHKAGFDPEEERRRWPRTDLIPFESEHRFMATLHHDHEGRGVVYVKGAPERVLEMCDRVRRDDGSEAPLEPGAWRERIEAIAAQGQRVLAVASMPAAREKRDLVFADVERGLCLLGMYGLIDPPREEAVRAVAECRAAGVRVKVITGDHAATARGIAGQLGLERADAVLTGADLERMDDTELGRAARDVDVFARAAPEHKLRLVTALQAGGAVVAMTGDGVNDAPALKRADVGIAMGRKGTEAAKGASDIVLADDNFASLARAVREGRTTYDNLKKAIQFLLPVNGGESMAIIGTILAGIAMPISPLQILWVNMVSSVALAMSLAFEPPEADVMRRPPREPGERILSVFVLWRIVYVSAIFFAGIILSFNAALAVGASFEAARTVAVNTLVAMEVAYLLSVRHLCRPSLTPRALGGNPVAWAAIGLVVIGQAVFTYAGFMHAVFATVPLDAAGMGLALGIAAAALLLFEFEKLVRWRAVSGRWRADRLVPEPRER